MPATLPRKASSTVSHPPQSPQTSPSHLSTPTPETPFRERSGLGLLFIIGFLGLTPWFAFQAVNAGGFIGDHGVFTVRSCKEVVRDTTQYGSRGDKTDETRKAGCHGTFRSDDGKIVDHGVYVSFTADDVAENGDAFLSHLLGGDAPGSKVSVQHRGPGSVFGSGYTPANPHKASLSSWMAFFGFALLGLGIFLLAANWPRSKGPSLGQAWRHSVGPGTRGVVIGLLAVSIVGGISAQLVVLFS
ncbi:hypothetical protein [Streptomyces sp. NPDC048650]|uniref:hypothetical protein n=1 Tax=unclassified Streptomyces TaxID=2593676 RepID=UPI0037193649